MAEISAGLVKELRELTGLGMMECKKALAECEGDLKKAEELLRIKSGAKASKAASRIAAEGVIGAWLAADGKVGALVELNSETDFVAKNEDFVRFAQSLAELAATRNPANVDELASIDTVGGKVEARRQALVQKIGENISIRRFKRMQARGKLALYLHGAKIGVLVDYEGLEEVGKDLAMHIAFAKPAYLNKTQIPQDVIADERRIQEARAKESGKPAEIIAKMVEGAVTKFMGERTLLGQPFVKDDKQTMENIVAEVAQVSRLGVEIGVVIGGGNIFRGVAPGAAGMDRATADYMGMLATVMNALALQDAMRHAGLASRALSALQIEQVVEPYIRGKAIRYLEEGKIVIFAAGTGNPFFTTDTAAALRGSEMGAEIVIKATKVDGVYTADPQRDPRAERYAKISFDEAIIKNLKVMDATALTLCRDQKLPINVFSIFKQGALKRVVLGEDEGT